MEPFTAEEIMRVRSIGRAASLCIRVWTGLIGALVTSLMALYVAPRVGSWLGKLWAFFAGRG